MADKWTSILLCMLLVKKGRGFFFPRNGVALSVTLFFTAPLWSMCWGFTLTLPSGILNADILPVDPYVLESEGMFTLNCSLKDSYTKRLNSSSMYFTKGGQVLEGSYVIDSRRIGILVQNISIDKGGVYACKIDETPVGGSSSSFLNQVTVTIGSPPAQVTELRCWSNNWDDMTCDWCPRTATPRLTRWTLKYQIDNDGPLTDCPQPSNCGCYFCSNCLDILNKSVRFQTLNLTIRAEDTNFGSTTSSFVVKVGLEIVKPGPVNDLTVIAVDSRTLNVTWQPPEGIMTSVDATQQLNYTVRYTSQWGDEDVYIGTEYNRSVLLLGLRPFTEYTVSVRSKTYQSEYKDLYLSDWKATVEKTLTDAAASGPAVVAYRWSEDCQLTSVNCQQIHFYFQKIPEIEKNGQIWGYKVRVGSENGLMLKSDYVLPSQYTTSSYELDTRLKHRLNITAITLGESGEEYSSKPTELQVDKYINKLEYPQYMLAETDASGTVHFTWDNSEPVDYLLLLKCKLKSDDISKCSTSPEVVRIDGNMTTYEGPVYESDYAFAMSAHRDVRSSGLTAWIPVCGYSEGPGKPVFTVTAEVERSLTVRWNELTCDREQRQGAPQKYLIQWTDKLGMKNHTVTASRRQPSYAYVISNLEPFTTYDVTMTAVSRGGAGGSSLNSTRTRESAPSGPPRSLHVVKVTSTSLTVNFKPPLKPNGNLSNIVYQIRVTSASKNQTVDALGTDTSAVISNLEGYTNYTVTMTARNEAGVSPVSAEVINQTLIRGPSAVQGLKVQRMDSRSSLVVSWNPPSPPNGPITGYIIHHRKQEDSHSQQEWVGPGKTAYQLDIDDCDMAKPSEDIFIAVQAVTENESGERVLGSQSEEVKESVCGVDALKLGFTIAGALFASGLIIGSLIFIFVKCRKATKKDDSLIKIPDKDGIHVPKQHEDENVMESKQLLENEKTEEEKNDNSENKSLIYLTSSLSSEESGMGHDRDIAQPLYSHSNLQLEHAGVSVGENNQKVPYAVYSSGSSENVWTETETNVPNKIDKKVPNQVIDGTEGSTGSSDYLGVRASFSPEICDTSNFSVLKNYNLSSNNDSGKELQNSAQSSIEPYTLAAPNKVLNSKLDVPEHKQQSGSLPSDSSNGSMAAYSKLTQRSIDNDKGDKKENISMVDCNKMNVNNRENTDGSESADEGKLFHTPLDNDLEEQDTFDTCRATCESGSSGYCKAKESVSIENADSGNSKLFTHASLTSNDNSSKEFENSDRSSIDPYTKATTIRESEKPDALQHKQQSEFSSCDSSNSSIDPYQIATLKSNNSENSVNDRANTDDAFWDSSGSGDSYSKTNSQSDGQNIARIHNPRGDCVKVGLNPKNSDHINTNKKSQNFENPIYNDD